MSRDSTRCMEPQIYQSAGAESTFQEERTILLARFAEKELPPDLHTIIQEHLSRCATCSQFFKELNDEEKSVEFSREMIDASCPSSLNLDRFVFSQNALSREERRRVDDHLQICPLCKEETEWLRNMEMQANKPAIHNAVKMPAVHNWFQYASIAAVLVFLAISIFLLLDRISIRNTEARLRSVAVVKEPDQIDYSALKSSSVVLPEKMNGIYEQGVKALKQRRFQEAIRHLEIVATAHPDHSGALFLTGYSYYQMNEPERAFQLCDQAEKMSPHSLERCLSLVNIALKTGHYRRALEEISGLHHAAPDHPEIKRTYDRITAISRGRTLRL